MDELDRRKAVRWMLPRHSYQQHAVMPLRCRIFQRDPVCVVTPHGLILRSGTDLSQPAIWQHSRVRQTGGSSSHPWLPYLAHIAFCLFFML